MMFDDPPGNGQSQTRSRRGVRFILPPEGLPDMRQIVCCDTAPGVADKPNLIQFWAGSLNIEI